MSSKFESAGAVEFYRGLLAQHGKTSAALGCSGKQRLRFTQLIDRLPLAGATILDVGCGFGDLVHHLDSEGILFASYIGIEVVPEFHAEAVDRYQRDNVKFLCGDFLTIEDIPKTDYVLGSGIFNLQFGDLDGYEYFDRTLKKMAEVANLAISVDFLSDKVDRRHPWNYHSSPLRVLDLAYSVGRRVLLRNDFFPFEFALTLWLTEQTDATGTVYL